MRAREGEIERDRHVRCEGGGREGGREVVEAVRRERKREQSVRKGGREEGKERGRLKCERRASDDGVIRVGSP